MNYSLEVSCAREWVGREPFVGVFRNGTSSIMGELDWIGFCWRFGWWMLFVVPIWEMAAMSGEVDGRRFRLMCNHLGSKFQFGT